MRKAIIGFSMLLLSACHTAPWYEVVVSTPEEIKKECSIRQKLGWVSDKVDCNKVLGLASPCVIWVPERNSTTEWIWQHELDHCKYGKFHD